MIAAAISGMVRHAHGLADVVQQRREHHLRIGTAALGTRRGLQRVRELVDREAVGDLGERPQHLERTVGDPRLVFARLAPDDRPLLGRRFVHPGEGLSPCRQVTRAPARTICAHARRSRARRFAGSADASSAGVRQRRAEAVLGESARLAGRVPGTDVEVRLGDGLVARRCAVGRPGAARLVTEVDGEIEVLGPELTGAGLLVGMRPADLGEPRVREREPLGERGRGRWVDPQRRVGSTGVAGV